MGIISLEKADRLYWIGRYTERVFTTLETFFNYYDTMLDFDEEAYKNYCRKIAIPDIYKDKDDFIQTYVFDKVDPNSIYSNMTRALDNAIFMRAELSSATLSYLQIALERVEKASDSRTILYHLQTVIDFLFAFWGCVDDKVDDEECRNILKCGKYIERLDLYLRLDYPPKAIEREFTKLLNRLHKIRFGYNISEVNELADLISDQDTLMKKKTEALNALGNIFEVI